LTAPLMPASHQPLDALATDGEAVGAQVL